MTTLTTEEKQQRLGHLAGHWENHCREVGHTPRSEDGDATFDASMDATYIRCCVPRCKWSYATGPKGKPYPTA